MIRDPRPMWAACAELCRHNPGFAPGEEREFASKLAAKRAEDDRKRAGVQRQLEFGEAA